MVSVDSESDFAQKEDATNKRSKRYDYDHDIEEMDWIEMKKDIVLMKVEMKGIQNENMNLRFRVEELETRMGNLTNYH